MKILHIADLIPSQPANGITEVLRNLMPEQRLLGHEVTCGIMRSKYAGSCENEFFLDFSTIRKFRLYIQSEKPDIVIFHSLYFIKYAIFAHYLKSQKIPYIIMFHGGATTLNYEKRTFIKSIYRMVCIDKFVKNAHGLIYLNRNEKNASIYGKFESKSVIIPNGVKLNNSSFYKGDGRISFIFLGRLDIHQKGLDILFEAISKIEAKFKERISIDFYGPHPPKMFLNWISKFSICKYHGPVFGDEKFEALKKHDIFILTSRFEGMPMTILEALACGLPCIVTPETNMGEIISEGDAGWVSSLTGDGIARTIEKAVLDYTNSCNRLIVNAKKIAEKYSWSKIAQLTLSEYNSFLKK